MRDLEDLDAPAEIKARFHGEHKPFGIWRGNLPVAELFFACSTQWRHAAAGMAGSTATGLDYAGVEMVARLSGRELTPEIFAGVQVMELAALDEWQRQRARKEWRQ